MQLNTLEKVGEFSKSLEDKEQHNCTSFSGVFLFVFSFIIYNDSLVFP